MLLDVREKDGRWTVTWQRPSHLQLDADSFSHLVGPVVTLTAQSIRETQDGLEMTFDDPSPGSTPDSLVLRLLDRSTAELSWAGFGSEPAVLRRESGEVSLGPWNSGIVYHRDISRPTNPEMSAIFDADQKMREHWDKNSSIAIREADAARLKRTQQILDSGKLRSGTDYYHAAFIFQHGQSPEDFLKAHSLAVVAAARGEPAATWIAAAALDRYLQSVGLRQVYGTQFTSKGGAWSQEPFDRHALPDSIRSALRVPVLLEQAEQLRRYRAEAVKGN